MIDWINLIKTKKPIFNFIKENTKHILYQATLEESLKFEKLSWLIKKIYIADGHHRFETYCKIA